MKKVQICFEKGIETQYIEAAMSDCVGHWQSAPGWSRKYEIDWTKQTEKWEQREKAADQMKADAAPKRDSR